MSRPEILTPTVHLNGTSRQDLLDQYQTAVDAVRAAITSLAASAPHARDYYVQSSTAALLAMRQHTERLNKMTEVQQQLVAIAEAIYRQGRN